MKFQSDILKFIFFYFFHRFLCKFFFTWIKIYKILSAKHHQEDNDRLQKNKTKQNKNKKKTVRGYQNLFKEEKENKWQYGYKCNKNLSEDEKQKIVDYWKKYYIMRKDAFLWL